ncbi:MAG: glycosyltransferase family 39 protein, partial [Patescibacteria group bacterium]
MNIKQNYLFVLIGIIIVGLVLRTINLQDTFFFGHDQARDLHEIYNIVYKHDIKIVGAGTDIPGLFGGPLYYYLLLIPYAISHFNPNSVAILLILINLTGIPLLWYFGKRLEGVTTGSIAALLWAISFEQANFSRFISNPSFLSIAALVYFLGLYEWCIRKKWWGLPLSVFGYGLGTQLDFYLVYLGIFYPVYFFIYTPPFTKKSVFTAALAGFMLFASFVVAEIHFSFLGIKSFLRYLSEQKEAGNLLGHVSLFSTSLAKSTRNALFALPGLYPLIPFSA